MQKEKRSRSSWKTVEQRCSEPPCFAWDPSLPSGALMVTSGAGKAGSVRREVLALRKESSPQSFPGLRAEAAPGL